MLDQMLNFFVSGFVYPGLTFPQALLGIGLGIAMGAIWFLPYWTSILREYWSWVVMITSVILTWTVVTFIQIPLQLWAGQALGHFWSQDVLIQWILLAGIPQILLSGLVQEGSKLVPVVIYWWRNNKQLTPKLGLIIGAIAGLGFGIFEAVWAHNRIFASGWSWQAVQASGLIALIPFWERLSAVALHIGASALAGYGLAKGRAWQFYLLAALLHSLMNYSVILYTAGLLTIIQLQIYASIIGVFIMAGALWLRWRRNTEEIPTWS
jgi:RsiW-degrading membrane proteinase PrsW (M82 family)